ncbi:hypothetical protein, partial [Burkholderia aenigmatica]|uniref:hypothetical protein n=1 Tax=Burkholderia aenigmatica TaxID=2015348 RepID=UPI00264DECED
VAEIGGKGAVAFGDGNPPPSTKLEFRKDSSFYRGDNYFAAGGLANRVKDTLQLCREFVSRSTGFHTSNGSRAVPVDRIARFIRPVAPYTPLWLSASLIPVRTDRDAHPRSRS